MKNLSEIKPFKHWIYESKVLRELKQYQVANYFGLHPGYFNRIYHGTLIPSEKVKIHIVAKLREAGYPELRYEDVWCPAETSNTVSSASA